MLRTVGREVTVSTKIRPILMFQGNAEEAMTFYVSLFPGGAARLTLRLGLTAA